MPTFANWLGQLLGQNEIEVQRLLEDENALHFLLAWSLFESKCFGNNVRASDLNPFASSCVNPNRGIVELLRKPAKHFHARYQDKNKLANLMPKDRTPKVMVAEFKELIGVDFDRLSEEQVVKLVAYVVYRFRNNIFHGAKGVASWLGFQEQIRLCVEALQVFVSHAEANKPTMWT